MLLRPKWLVNLSLLLREKPAVLKISVAPCCYVAMRVHVPVEFVVRHLNGIQSVAWGPNSWVLMRHTVVDPHSLGGIGLAGMGSYALRVHSKAFVPHIKGTTLPHTRSPGESWRWAEPASMVLTVDMLPYLTHQEGCCKPFGYLGTSCMAYMELRRQARIVPSS